MKRDVPACLVFKAPILLLRPQSPITAPRPSSQFSLRIFPQSLKLRVTDIYCHSSAGRRTTAALALVGDLLLHYRRTETYCVRTGGRGATAALTAGARLPPAGNYTPPEAGTVQTSQIYCAGAGRYRTCGRREDRIWNCQWHKLVKTLVCLRTIIFGGKMLACSRWTTSQ